MPLSTDKVDGGSGHTAAHNEERAAINTRETEHLAHVANVSNPHSVTKAQVGLSNVPNTDATARANHTGTQSADTLTDGTTNKAFLATERTKLTGIATAATANDTDANLKARANHTGTQLASTVSDFSTAADARIAAAAATGTGSIVRASAATMANPTFTGTATTAAIKVTGGTPGIGKVLISDSVGNGTWSVNPSGVTDHTQLTSIGTNTHAQIDTHIASTNNPHATTKAQVGLSVVDNTADADKPISTAQAAGLQAKDATLTALAALTTAANQMIYSTGADTFSQTSLTAAARTFLAAADATAERLALGLDRVENTTDLEKEISTATAASLATKPERVFNKRTIASAYTVVLGDELDRVLHTTSATALTITLPSDASAAITVECVIPWRQYAAGQITFAAGSGATIIAHSNWYKSAGQYAEGTVTKTAANTWLISGDTAA